jgi:hypothetical protein
MKQIGTTCVDAGIEIPLPPTMTNIVKPEAC